MEITESTSHKHLNNSATQFGQNMFAENNEIALYQSSFHTFNY